MNTEIKQAMVIDYKNRPLGSMLVNVLFWGENQISCITHNGTKYFPTGKTGQNNATGKAVVELASDEDARLWATLDANMIFED